MYMHTTSRNWYAPVGCGCACSAATAAAAAPACSWACIVAWCGGGSSTQAVSSGGEGGRMKTAAYDQPSEKVSTDTCCGKHMHRRDVLGSVVLDPKANITLVSG